jgi:DNA-directed RNA polymerase I, II, and III subunit RPABC5
MIIPVRCFTCGKVIGDKYDFYLREVRKIKLGLGHQTTKVVYLTKDFMDKTPEGTVMDQLGLNKQCCRKHMLTHVDIE